MPYERRRRRYFDKGLLEVLSWEIISKILDKEFPNPKIALNYKNDYTLLIAVMLSATSRDSMVNRITKDLFKNISSPKDMLLLGEEKLEKMIHIGGLSKSKSKNIIKSSKILHNLGKIPRELDELKKLPGVGHKTASVMVLHFGGKAFPVDRHIYRCSRLWGLSKKKSIAGVEEDLKRLIPRNQWAKSHLQIIFFSRKFCSKKSHNINHCPICSKLPSLDK